MVRRLLLLGLLAAPSLTLAHHSRLFLLTTTFDMGHGGEVLALADLIWARNAGRYDFSASPGLYFAIGDEGRFGLEIHGHFAEEDGSPLRHRATGIEARYRITNSPNWNHAVGFEYEAGARGGEPGGWSARYIVGREDMNTMIMANLIAAHENHGEKNVDWFYSFAYGKHLKDRLSAGIEMAGGFRKEDSQELLPQLGLQLPDGSLIKAGIGIGLNRNTPTTTIRIGYVGHLR